ncbi:hypothetical protein LO763_00150 [Glycomyces sp. A-F 0318]|uniref:hypothetical protein n=1 Tax=Glycomyces amatae TaxID=2881355 RepID=UPI001E2D1937|nr:hypothetical protein [Glycomyces amatae]MCD0442038.1 hypothetical protein [Glycomyces amatae]
MTDGIDELRRRVVAAQTALDDIDWDGVSPVIGVPGPRERTADLPVPLQRLYSVFDGCEAFPLMEISGYADVRNAFRAEVGDGPVERLLRDEVGIGTVTSSDLLTVGRGSGSVSLWATDDFMSFEETGEPIERRLFVEDPIAFFTEHLFGAGYREHAFAEDDPWLALLVHAKLA